MRYHPISRVSAMDQPGESSRGYSLDCCPEHLQLWLLIEQLGKRIPNRHRPIRQVSNRKDLHQSTQLHGLLLQQLE